MIGAFCFGGVAGQRQEDTVESGSVEGDVVDLDVLSGQLSDDVKRDRKALGSGRTYA